MSGSRSHKESLRVVAAVIRRDGKILIGQRPERDRRGGLWEFPGGKVKPGEDDRTALRRELQEELSLDVGVERKVSTERHDYGDIAVEIHFYECRIQSDQEPTALHHAAIAWAAPKDLESYVFLEADESFVEKLKKGDV